MLFNSLSFAIFLPIVFILYWVIGSSRLRAQNVLLIVSSYYFYACWDWRFLFLLVFSTLLDFYSGVKIAKANSQHSKKLWLLISIVINLGILGVFKYYNFFSSSFADALSLLGVKVNMSSLEIILPVGISFYTFHGLSYVIDIYYNKIDYEKDFINYSLFVSFFPLLVAGPIERATHLLPQIVKKREFNYAMAVDGLRQILWGLFKKIVIADNCAEFANVIFNNSSQYSGSTLFLGALFFTFQIYGDFSGYTDIALGTARLFGIELLRNFAYPYFSRDIAEFWRRWHISLSSWFRDYLYIPLGGSKYGKRKAVRNTFIIFLVSGFWHGANWTFIFWGLLNALFIIPSILRNKNRTNLEIVAKDKLLPTINEAFSIIYTFIITVFLWIFFRSESIGMAFSFIKGIISLDFFTVPTILPKPILILIIFFMCIEWMGRRDNYAIENLFNKSHILVKYLSMYTIIILIYLFGNFFTNVEFIYFQF